MKLNKNIFICALLALMILMCINAASASDTFEEDLAANATASEVIGVDETGSEAVGISDDDTLSGGNTIIVDGGGDGKISAAVSSASGGDTIYIKNGEYSEDAITFTQSLNIVGESQDGVIIKKNTGNTELFVCTDSIDLTFSDFSIKDSSKTSGTGLLRFGGGNINWINCTFDNLASKYGAMQYSTTGTVNIEDCTFTNVREAGTGSGTGAIYISSAATVTINNCLFDNCGNVYTSGQMYGLIYHASRTGSLFVNATTITNTYGPSNSIIRTQTGLTIRNSKIYNNTVQCRSGTIAGESIFYGTGAADMDIQQCLIANNTCPKYLLYANTANPVTFNYNNVYGNDITNDFGYDYSTSNKDLNYNYWGEAGKPSDIPDSISQITIVKDGDSYKLSNGEELTVVIPGLNDEIVDPNTTYVSPDGDDANDGSEGAPVKTIAKAVELANAKNGQIIIAEGTYTENNIVLNPHVVYTITGKGNVEINGNASANSIFVMHGGQATFTNIRFTNNKAKYGGAIFINEGIGSSRTTVDIDVTVNKCSFEDIESTDRGGAIYAWYTAGNLIIKGSTFKNINSGSYGAVTVGFSAFENGLNVEISDSIFEGNTANNGAAAYLQAKTVKITGSTFANNSASFGPGAIFLYNGTATIDNCKIYNNTAAGAGAAIHSTMPSSAPQTTVTITNSIIENNYGTSETLPAIYVDMNIADISYCALINDLSVETRTASSYDGVYGQGVAIVNNNWWGTNDPSNKVKGKEITFDKWVIMNVQANATQVVLYDEVEITVDFSHVNTTSGEIEELAGGVIPIDSFTVNFAVDNGTITPQSVEVLKGKSASAIYEVADPDAIVTVTSGDVEVTLDFSAGVEPYFGVIYLSADGDDNNNGSQDAPVATLAKAIELALHKHGSGEIIISEGTYAGSDFKITRNLTVTGVGKVTLDNENQATSMFNIASGAGVGTLALSNLNIVNVARGYGAFVYNYGASEVILDNITFVGNTNTNVRFITSNTGALTIRNSVMSNNTLGGIICHSGSGNLTIINSTFENNMANKDSGVYGLVYFSSGSGAIIIEDCVFKNNSVRQNIVYSSSGYSTPGNAIYMKNTEISYTKSDIGHGAAIRAQDKLVVDNCVFINNVAYRNGGAINIDSKGDATITNSVFMGNLAGSSDKGDIIYNSGKLTINYCVLLNDGTHKAIYNAGSYGVNAQYNWWGTNDDPKDLNGVDRYYDYDEWEYVDCEYPDVSNWIVMNVTAGAASVKVGDSVEITADFTKYMDSNGTLKDLTKQLPEFSITATSNIGKLDVNEAAVKDGIAKFTYTATDEGHDTVNVTSGMTVPVEINAYIPGAIYVSATGNDNNNGLSEDTAVASIAKAIELAEVGKIIILDGTYTIDETLKVNKDLDIKGKGTVTVDGNQKRILENTANLNLTNIAFTNGKAAFASVILNDGNMTINNCSFFSNKATGTSNGNAINNRKGSMVIENSKFYENVASRGAISSQTGTTLLVNNSEFYNNDMTSLTTTYGMIYSNSADTIVENTVFRNNKVKAGGAIYATRSSSGTTGTLEITNCTFDNNTAYQGQGGAIFAGRTPTTIRDSTFTNNQAISGSYAKGQGGAIYQTIDDVKSAMTIDNCIFINNTAGDDGAAFYVNTNQGTFTVTNSVILNKEGDTTAALAKKEGATTVIVAENNYWGNNTEPSSESQVDVIITLDVTINPIDAHAGDEVTITATFSQDVPEGVELTFTSNTNKLNENVVVKDRKASVTYTLDADDREVIISMDGVELERVPFAVPDVIYVLPGASDSNDGSFENPVGTIEKALKLAVKGSIVLLEGTHKVSDLGIISSDLNITGNGTVIIDAQNNNRILYVGSDAKVVISNVVMINGYTPDGSGGLLGNSNELTLINCTLANSSAGENNGGAIYNVGKLTIINSTLANNTAREGGAIFTNDALAKGASIIIENSAFENNIATGNDNLGGGAIFTQQIAEFSIANSTFRENEAQKESSGGAIFISHSTATITITDSEFISNFANGQSDVGGGAIYMSGTSNYERKGTLDIKNSLFEYNGAGYDGGAIYVRATTLKIANSALIDNYDQNEYAIFGYGTEQVNPSITANDNWWGSNDDPNDKIGGYRFTPKVDRWAIMTFTNDSEIKAGENVLLTVSINTYTTGSENGTLASPIAVALPVTVKTSSGDIEGKLDNGEFATEYLIPDNVKYISASLNDETVVLYVIPTETTVEISDITAKQGEMVTFEIKVVANDGTVVNSGHVELYIDDDLIANIMVIDGNATDKFMISNPEGIYTLTAKFIDDSLVFTQSNATATLNVSGINNIVTQENFFEFFTDNGVLLSSLPFSELIFKGEFKELGIDVITLNKPVSILGDGAVLNNIAISVLANDVNLNNITLNADADFENNAGAAIFVMGSGVALDNVVVNYTVPQDTEGFGIYAYESSEFTLTNSKIIFDGNNLNSPVKNHALRIWECDDVVVKGNLINATLPSVNCDWGAWGSMDTDLVLAVGIQRGENILFTENEVFSNVKAAADGYPTLDTIIVYGTTDIEISYNNITETDFTGEGIPGYSYCVDLYNFDGATVAYNNIYVKTSTGIEGAGTAYCVQATGPYTGFVIDHNNITAIGAGPALGIYSQNYNGETDIEVTNNNINVTGLATGNYYALVSGMELQDTVAKVYNNTIYTYNVGEGTDGLFGISYAQITGGRHNFDVQNNTVITEGAYAVYFMSAQDSTVKNNILYSDDLLGDEAANIGGGSGNVIEGNYPVPADILVEATDVFEGQATTVTVTVPDAAGSVTIRVNNREYTVDLIDGVAVKDIEDYGEDFTVEATFNGDLKYLPNTNSTTFKKLDNIITPEEFYSYFESDGSLKSAMPYSELIFNGTFEDFPTIVIKKSVVLKGEDSIFIGFGISIKASDVTVDGFTIIISVDEEDAIAVNAEDVDDVSILNNYLYLESNITEDTYDANALNLDGVTGASVLNNVICTSLPALFASNYDWDNFMMGLNTVNPVRIRNCDDVVFIFNDVESNVNDVSASYPTIQCLFVVGSENVLIDSNNFTMDDKVSPEGKAVYLYAINFGYDKNTTVLNNNFYISTSSGVDSAGSAYALQGVESELYVLGNNITTISNGPNLGFYVSSMMGGSSELYIEGNTINVTGYAASGAQWALVSGIEITNGNAKIYNNTIYTYNKAGFVEDAPVHGISYGQYMYGSRSVDAQDNTIYTQGTYTVSFLESSGMSITNNYLIAHDLKGDESVYGAEIVKDNLPAKANLTVSVDNITIGDAAVINISIDKRIVNDVSVLVNGKYYTLEIKEGKGSVNVTGLGVGQYTVTATYAGDENVLADENSTTFKVDKTKSDVIISLGNVTVGQDVDVCVTVPGVSGEITLYVDGAKQTLTLTDGSANYTIPEIAAGDHSVTVIFMGDGTHAFATNTTKFTVEKLTVEIEVPSIEIFAGEIAEFDIKFSENVTGDVRVNVAGKNLQFEIVNGTAHVIISGLQVGVHNVVATYPANDIYAQAVNNTATITVTACDSGLSANASDIKIGENASISIEINKEITKGVKVVFNGTEYPVVLRDGKGVVVIPDLAKGNYTASVIFEGNDKYAPKEVEVNFTVSKKEIPADINVTMDIPEGTTAPEFSVTLPGDATGNISVTVDGNKTYSAAVVNGSATVKTDELAVGNHTVSLAYTGDDNYDGFTTDNKTVDIPKASIPGGEDALNLTSPEGSDSPTYSINLPGATGNLTATVDGKTYSAPLVNGTASLTVPGLTPGDHNITVAYSGDNKFSGISKNTTYHVPVPEIKQNKDVSAIYSAKASYKVLITKDGKAVGAGEKVVITFNGKKTTVKTDKKGYATLKLNTKVKVKKYTITAEYKGVKATNKVTIKHVIKASNKKVKKSKKVTKVKITLKKVNGKYLKNKKVKIKLKGKKYKAKTNKKGVATWKVKKSMVKKLKVNKKYKYTVTYGKDKVVKKLTIKK